MIGRGQSSIGMSNRIQPPATLPPPANEDFNLQELIDRIANVEVLVERKADASNIRSLIAISDEAIVLQAKSIAMFGEVTIADIINEQNGTTDGLLPSSITRIVGGKIQTGIITSTNWGPSAGTAIDLDNGTITIGGSENPSLVFENGNLTISGRITADSIVLGKDTTLGELADDIQNAITESGFLAALDDALADGVGNVMMGQDGDFRLTVSGTSVVAQHKDAVYNASAGAGYSGDLRTGLIVTANGVGMGYNRKSDGAWVDAVAIESTGDVLVRGTLVAGSVIAGAVVADGEAISTIKDRANAGNSHASSTGNPHGASLNQISGDLSMIANGVNAFKMTSSQQLGANRAHTALDGSADYIRTLGTTKIAVVGSNPSNGLIIDSAGLRAYNSGSPTFSISATTGAATYAGDINTSGQVIATGTTSSSVGEAAIVGSGPFGVRGVIGQSGSNIGVHGISIAASGVCGEATTDSAAGVLARGAGNTGIALLIAPGRIEKSRVAGHILDLYDASTGAHTGSYEYRFRAA